MDGLAAQSSERLDWRRSIVDLMKLIKLDSSLAARKELAQFQRGEQWLGGRLTARPSRLPTGLAKSAHRRYLVLLAAV